MDFLYSILYRPVGTMGCGGDTHTRVFGPRVGKMAKVYYTQEYPQRDRHPQHTHSSIPASTTVSTDASTSDTMAQVGVWHLQSVVSAIMTPSIIIKNRMMVMWTNFVLKPSLFLFASSSVIPAIAEERTIPWHNAKWILQALFAGLAANKFVEWPMCALTFD